MDTILNDGAPQLIIMNNNSFEKEDLDHESVSMWVIDKNRVSPTTNIVLSTKLEPGFYIADFDRNFGYFCTKIEPETDELCVFSNSITKDLINEINLFWDKKTLYNDKKILHKRGIFLQSGPGNGKTSLITQIANRVIALKGVVFKVTDLKNFEDYVGFMTEAFRRIEPETFVMTIMEDIEKYNPVESELLDFLDGKSNINHHIVLATSNNSEEISDSVLRSSRFDLKIELDLPSEITRREYFEFKEVPNEDIEYLIKETKDCSLADLKEIYTRIYILDYLTNDAILMVKNPTNKKNYLYRRPLTKMGL